MMYLYIILYYDLGIVLEWSRVKVLIDILADYVVSKYFALSIMFTLSTVFTVNCESTVG